MKLTIEKRTTGKKGVTNRLRRDGQIPAVVYSLGHAGVPIAVRSDEMQEVLRKIPKGHLATTVFELKSGTQSFKAIVKDVQYHFATYDIEHIDFLELKDDQEVTVNIPIQMEGVADCAGVKLGGFLRQVIRAMKVTCLPKHIPQNFTLDVRNLGIGGSFVLGDLKIPEKVRPRAKLQEVAVIVVKKAG